ncbi:peptidase MA family metallohydrolase [Candidatus Latescibacterota bacterium]
MKIRRIVILSAVIAALLLPAGIRAEDILNGNNFDVIYTGLNKGYAEEVLKNSEDSYAIISKTLGHSLEQNISITLTTSSEQFHRLTSDVLPEWSAAAAIGNENIVVSPLPGRKQNLTRIMAHEIIHIVINDAAGEIFVPRWFHEGCAQNFSGEWNIRDRIYMLWKVSRGKLLSFEDIQNVFSAQLADAGLAYDQSMLAIRQFMKKNGRSAMPAVIDGMKNGNSFADAFYEASGLWPSEFEKEYLEYIRKNYGKRSLYSIIPGTWTLIMIIAFIVYFIKRRRNKRLMQQWEIVEAAENIINFRDYSGPSQ